MACLCFQSFDLYVALVELIAQYFDLGPLFEDMDSVSCEGIAVLLYLVFLSGEFLL